jgi:4-aminobutyrate aminotransferase-like enzyme
MFGPAASSRFDSIKIIDAQADLLRTSDGRTLIDLFTAHGTAWLGHCHPTVRDAIQRQLDKIWITGGYETPMVQEMRKAMNAFLPAGYSLASLASAGMEANEQAYRIARVTTGRTGALGFAGAMHGKSFLTAAIAWDNGDGLEIPKIHRVPCGPGLDETATLVAVEAILRNGGIAAIFVEPIHATSFGWQGTQSFYRALRELTTEYSTLLVYDEVLTGFYRTGPKFCFLQHDVKPDIVVFGKACGNGFPVGGVAIRGGLTTSSKMMLGSTFSNNPLAAAAVYSTLQCLQALNPEILVQQIERTVLQHLRPAFEGTSICLSGAGAMWVIQLPSAEHTTECALLLLQEGVCVDYRNCQLRLMPPITIRPENLHSACQKIANCVSLVS